MSNANAPYPSETPTCAPACTSSAPTDHFGMSFRTHFQPDITIAEVRGEVDACNADRLSDYVDDLAGSGWPLIVDLCGVDFFGGEGFQALVRIAQKFQRTAGRWALVTSEAVDRLLEIADSNYRLPTNASVEEALRQLAFPDECLPLGYRVTPPEVTRC